MKNKFKHKKSAYSLIETIVSIVIFAFMLFMVSNVLILYIQLNQSLQARFQIRSELAHVTNLIKRDIRNADNIGYCTKNVCELVIQQSKIRWYLFTDVDNITHINRCTLTGSTCLVASADSSTYSTSNILNAKLLNFDQVQDYLVEEQFTITFTINVASTNESLKISDQVSQELISARRQKLL